MPSPVAGNMGVRFAQPVHATGGPGRIQSAESTRAQASLHELPDGTLQQVLTHWRSTIQQGNKHYRLMAPDSLAQALSLFQDALLMADVLLEQWLDADVAMAAYVVSPSVRGARTARTVAR